jgi:hypothetical protein
MREYSSGVQFRTSRELDFSEGRDKVSWHLELSGPYSIRSMYNKLSQGTTVTYFKDIWEAKVPLKMKFSPGNLPWTSSLPVFRLPRVTVQRVVLVLFVEHPKMQDIPSSPVLEPSLLGAFCAGC